MRNYYNFFTSLLHFKFDKRYKAFINFHILDIIFGQC